LVPVIHRAANEGIRQLRRQCSEYSRILKSKYISM
jgi:hypothetical protein